MGHNVSLQYQQGVNEAGIPATNTSVSITVPNMTVQQAADLLTDVESVVANAAVGVPDTAKESAAE